MNRVWLVIHGSNDGYHYTTVSAAFASKEAAKAFQESHEKWLKNMDINGYTDCFSVPLDPDYTDEGYVLVEKNQDGNIETRPLEHVLAHWPYIGQCGQVNKTSGKTWVILKAINQEAAKEKAIELFDNPTTEDSLGVQ